MSTTSSTSTNRPAPTSTMAVPERLGRYQLARVLGRGVCADVFAGCDPKLDRPVAIKVFSQRTPIEDVEHEGSVLALVTHPNVIAAGSRPYMDRVLLRGLAVEPRLRFESMSALVDALTDVLTEPDRRRARWRSIAIALASVALAGLLDRCI